MRALLPLVHESECVAQLQNKRAIIQVLSVVARTKKETVKIKWCDQKRAITLVLKLDCF